MDLSTAVRVAILIYVLFAGIALFLLWRNSASQDSLKNAGILLASVLPVLIAVLPYLKSEKLEKHYTYCLFFDSKTKYLATGDFNPYDGAYTLMFANLEKIPEVLKGNSFEDFMGSKGLDIVERGIISALFMKFSNSWNISEIKTRTPGWGSIQWKADQDCAKTVISAEQIRNIFQKNPTITTPQILPLRSLALPDGTSFFTKIENDKERSIIFENPYIRMQIKMLAESGGVVQRGVWGVFPEDPHDMNRYYTVNFDIQLLTEFKFSKLYSPQMPLYRKWHENIGESLAQYDWGEIEKRINEHVTRKALKNLLKE